MCLLVMISRMDPEAPLVVGANRDERLERPAIPITVLRPASPRILGGRDELAGGTWLAVNEHGVVAALTNRPAPDGRDPTKRSRGELPIALAEHSSAQSAVDDFVTRFKPTDYNPSGLLVADRSSIFSIDMTGSDVAVAAELPAGVHVLENVPFGEPSAKVDHVRGLLGPIYGGRANAGDYADRLKVVLADHSLPPEIERVEGEEPKEGERLVETHAACVHTENYGTRSSTIVIVGADETAPISVEVADGPPCSEPFIDQTELWEVAR